MTLTQTDQQPQETPSSVNISLSSSTIKSEESIESFEDKSFKLVASKTDITHLQIEDKSEELFSKENNVNILHFDKENSSNAKNNLTENNVCLETPSNKTYSVSEQKNIEDQEKKMNCQI